MEFDEVMQILHENGFLLEDTIVEKVKGGANVLNRAARNKDDEFYTFTGDIERELENYNFSGKVVYCCCDNPEWSNFYKFFEKNFDSLGLKGLISSHFESSGETYWTEFDGTNFEKHPLKGNGDCRSEECQELANMADIIVTNPPFSLFQSIVQTYYKKPFIMVCTPLKMTQGFCFELYKQGKIRYGYTTLNKFYRPDGDTKNVQCAWYTNLPVNKSYKKLNLVPYDEEQFPKFDNEDIISVKSQKFIPDTDEKIGLPVSIIINVDPNNLPFEILGIRHDLKLNGKNIFDRLVVKLK